MYVSILRILGVHNYCRVFVVFKFKINVILDNGYCYLQRICLLHIIPNI